ncbi:septum formation protein [Thiogranum longum]|uniref:7-methyl-GTP pyrophosphatase n=1 Tax=Thiogranum longum TaxID=1537524 RepID=A0A4R1H925_9GAMM|nr:Maf family protein [Thiogranum longum]TCK18357.1 septum formation protein [Thiogranum longum]
MSQGRTLVLASTSPFRRALLEKLQVSFETLSPDVDETRQEGESPQKLVVRLSEAKARAGAQTYPDALIIGSDQVAVCGDEVLGKPGNHDKACQQLEQLSGQRVEFLTGICLFDSGSGKARTNIIPFAVTFRELSATQIERYLRTEQPYNCAGSFKSEALGISLFEAMHGDDPNALIGLPLIQLVTWLNEAGVNVP